MALEIKHFSSPLSTDIERVHDVAADSGHSSGDHVEIVGEQRRRELVEQPNPVSSSNLHHRGICRGLIIESNERRTGTSGPGSLADRVIRRLLFKSGSDVDTLVEYLA